MPVFAMQSLYKQHEMQSPVNLTGFCIEREKTGGISLPFLLVITYLVLMETEKHILFLMFFNIIIQSTTFRDYEMSLTL